MDVTGIDIGALIAGIGGLVKGLHSDRVTASSKKTLDERCTQIEGQLKNHDQRLDAGERKFELSDAKMDRVLDRITDVDKNVSTILGYMKGKESAIK